MPSSARIACLALAAAVVQAPAAPVDYARQIAPLLDERCADCHAASDPDGEFALDSFDALIKGGKTGKAIEAGKAADSLLVKFLEGRSSKTGKNQFMPPGSKEHLSAEQIAMIRQWIDEGARGPSAGTPVNPLEKLPKVASKTSLKPVSAIEVSPQGKVVAIGRSGVVELVDGATRHPLLTLAGIAGKPSALAFSADGMNLFVAAGDAGVSGLAYQFAVADGKLVRTFTGHTDALYALALSPDGRQLATGGYDQKIKLWDPATGKEIRTLKGHNGCINGLSYRPDGKVLASASADRTVKLWDPMKGTRLDTFSQPLKEQFAVAFAADGRTLVAGGADSRIRQWSISANATEGSNPLLETKFAHEGAVLRLAMSPDGKWLISSSSDRTLKIWNPAHVTQQRQLEAQSDWASAVAWADAGHVVAGRMDGSTAVYDTASGKAEALVVMPPPAPMAMAAKKKKMPPAKPGAPVITRLEPRGFQSGITATVRAVGLNIAGITQVTTSDPRLKITAMADAKGMEAMLTLTSPKDLPRGPYDISFVTAAGETAKVQIQADDLPQFSAGQVPAAAPLPFNVWGTLMATGQQDRQVFQGRAGQTLVLDLAAQRIGSAASTIQLEVFDSTGRRLVINRGLDSGTDPFIAFHVPADGAYTAQVSETTLEGSADHAYRLSIGALPYVTGWSPLSVKAHAETEVQLVGCNLPDTSVKVTAGDPGMAVLPLNLATHRSRAPLSVTVTDMNEVLEQEPNDTPATAQAVAAPVSINGRLHVPGKPEAADADIYAFNASAGEEWMIETVAQQAGTPTDTRLEILKPDGSPVERLKLQAVRSSSNVFRSVDADNPDIRLENYTETGLDEYVYFNGDVMKTFRVPRGPDGGFLFYSSGNKRRAYFDTSATAHPLDEPCYIVEPLKAGQMPVANGLPVLSLPYANDDDGLRKLGRDSRLHFTAPAAGRYLVRVTDSRGWSGQRNAYRLIIRKPAPDFAINLTPASIAVGAGDATGFALRADRKDDFEAAITVRIEGLPTGWQASSPIVIQEGHTLASGSLHADENAMKDADWSKVRITATAGSLSHSVKSFSKVTLGPKPGFITHLEPSVNDRPVARTSSQPQVITIVPGQLASAFIRVERFGNEGILNFDVHGLPHGVIVDDIGLNGIQVREKENEREIRFACAKWVPGQERLIHCALSSARAEADSTALATSFPVLLRVVSDSKVAGK